MTFVVKRIYIGSVRMVLYEAQFEVPSFATFECARFDVVLIFMLKWRIMTAIRNETTEVVKSKMGFWCCFIFHGTEK